MTIGIQTFNSQGNLNIDESSVSYVYLGKYATAGVGEQTVDVTCVGYPMIFFDIPYSLAGDANPTSTDHNDSRNRWGATVRKVESVGTNTWRVYYIMNYATSSNLITMYIRVFGVLSLNYPSGSSNPYGFRIFDANGKVVFDSGFRMFRLAGNTYDMEIALTGSAPNQDTAINSCDVTVAMPFNMSGKAICANIRGVIWKLYNIGSYIPWDGDPTPIEQYDKYMFETLYYSYGSTLEARRVATDWGSYESQGSTNSFDSGNANTTYTRLAVIDTTKFP